MILKRKSPQNIMPNFSEMTNFIGLEWQGFQTLVEIDLSSFYLFWFRNFSEVPDSSCRYKNKADTNSTAFVWAERELNQLSRA